jgi:hypothetical protein
MPSIIQLANPAEYHDLDPYRDQIRKIYAPIVWDVVESLRRDDLNEITRNVVANLFDRVAKAALWAVTETHQNADFKYLGQRYISRGVYDRWANLIAGRVTQKFRYYKDGRRIVLRHEHVVPRQLLKDLLSAAESRQEVHAVLQRPVSCIVTVEENGRLPKGGDGWERYVNRIEVFDRRHQKWVDLQQLADGQDGG